MTNSQYLFRGPSSTCFVRLYVPARMNVAVGNGEIHRTTGCKDFRLARIVAAELAGHWHRAIHALECMDITKIKAGSISCSALATSVKPRRRLCLDQHHWRWPGNSMTGTPASTCKPTTGTAGRSPTWTKPATESMTTWGA